jgi:hypothetical protein
MLRTPRPGNTRCTWSIVHLYSGYQHFRGSGGTRWGLGPTARMVLAGVTLAGGVYYWRSIETVPYTARRHAILFVSRAQEQAMGQAIFKQARGPRGPGAALLVLSPGVAL